MEVKICKKCRRMFNYIAGEQLCPNCRQKLEEKFREVKDYLSENRHASVMEVAIDCEIEEKQIRQWIREERLVFAESTNTGMFCERCGKPVSTGQYCDKCKSTVIKDLYWAAKGPAGDKPVIKQDGDHKNKMRYFKV